MLVRLTYLHCWTALLGSTLPSFGLLVACLSSWGVGGRKTRTTLLGGRTWSSFVSRFPSRLCVTLFIGAVRAVWGAYFVIRAYVLGFIIIQSVSLARACRGSNPYLNKSASWIYLCGGGHTRSNARDGACPSCYMYHARTDHVRL